MPLEMNFQGGKYWLLTDKVISDPGWGHFNIFQ